MLLQSVCGALDLTGSGLTAEEWLMQCLPFSAVSGTVQQGVADIEFP